jgi:hypothetical protein
MIFACSSYLRIAACFFNQFVQNKFRISNQARDFQLEFFFLKQSDTALAFKRTYPCAWAQLTIRTVRKVCAAGRFSINKAILNKVCPFSSDFQTNLTIS